MPEDQPSSPKRGRNYILLYLLLLPILLAVICFGAQIGVMTAGHNTFGDAISPRETADYSGDNGLSFRAIGREAITEAFEERNDLDPDIQYVATGLALAPTQAPFATLDTNNPVAVAEATESAEQTATSDANTSELTETAPPTVVDIDRLQTESAINAATETVVAGYTNTPTPTDVTPSITPSPTITDTPMPTVPNGPTAAFQVFEDRGTVTFVNQSSGTIDSHVWEFGDGTTSDEFSPVYTYTEPGDFFATLTVTGPDGTDSIGVIITVLPAPTLPPPPPPQPTSSLPLPNQPTATLLPPPVPPTGIPNVSLSLSLSPSSLTPAEGDTINYSLRVTNNSGINVNNVNLSLSFPSGLTPGGATTTSGNYSGSTWSIPAIVPSASAQLDIPVQVNAGTVGTTLTVTANVTGSDPANSGQTSVSSSIVVVGPPEADLVVVNSVSSGTANELDTLVYNLSVTNNGPDAATNVQVANVLPAGVSIVSESHSQGNLTGNIWSVGNLPAGAPATLQVVVTVDVGTVGQTLASSATASGNEIDPNPFNNSDDAPVLIQLAAGTDLALAISTSTSPVDEGDTVTFDVTLTNNGPITATAILIDATMIPGLTYVSSVGDGAYAGATWSVTTLNSGASTTLTIQSTANVGTGGSTLMQNVALIGANQPDTNAGNNAASVNVNVNAVAPLVQADLALNKTSNASAGTALIGETFDYTLTVTNNGPDTANNVVITDTLPAEVSFVSSAQCTAVGQAVTCNMGTIANGANGVATVTVSADSAGDPVTNSASVTADETDPNAADNTASASVTINPAPPQADLALSKVASVGTATVGETFDYTLTVTNNGPDTANNVVITDTLPAEVSFVTSAQCTAVGQAVTCNMGTIANGANGVASVTVSADSAGDPVTNSASVTADETDPNAGDNTASASVTINPAPPQADLALSKVASVGTATVGETFDYTLTVTNNGPDTANNVVITDTLPAEVSFVTSAQCTAVGQAVTCNMGTIANGANGVASVTVSADSTGDPVTNSASVTADETDPNAADNTASASVTINAGPAVDLFLQISATQTTLQTGETFDFNYQVTNFGPDTATNTILTVTLPAELSFVSSGTCSAAGQTVTCNVGTIVAGIPFAVGGSFSAQADAVGDPVTTDAIVAADEPEPNNLAANDQMVNVTVIAPPEADLALSKVASVGTATVGETFDYTLTVTNNGPDTANNVVINDTLPAEVSFVSSAECTALGQAVTCNMGTIANGANGVATVTVSADTAGDPVTNGASVTADETDPNAGNNAASANVTIDTPPPEADLSISLSPLTQTVNVGDTFIIDVRVDNLGPDITPPVEISIALEAELAVNISDVSCSQVSNVVTCEMGSGYGVGGFATRMLTFEALSPGSITQAISINPTGIDLNNSNDTASFDVTINPTPPEADLALSKVASVTTATVGETFDYTFSVTNNGPQYANNITITDTLPPEVSYVSGACSESGGILTCNLGSINNGVTTNRTITVQAVAAGDPVTNSASVTADETDPNAGDNTASASVTINPAPPQADLALSKIASVGTATVGETFDYTLTVTNNGPDTANNVVITDTLPVEVSFVSSAECTAVGQAVTCNMGTIANGANGVATVTVSADSAGDPVTNSASVTADETDPNAGDNTASASVTINPAPPEADLGLSVVPSVGATTVGSTVDYAFIVTNNGPDTAENVQVTTTLPTEVSFDSSIICTAVGQDVTCNLGNMTNGGISIAAITVQADIAGDPVTTTATVTTTTTDPVSANDSSSADVTINAATEADLNLLFNPTMTTIQVGNTFDYSYLVTNAGPDDASNTTLTTTLPPEISFLSSATCSAVGQDVTCNIGTVTNGGFGSGWFTVQANLVGDPVTTSATVDADEPDSTPGDNTSSVDVTITNTPTAFDVELSLSTSETIVETLDYFDYTYTVTNNGPGDANNVTISNLLPFEVFFDSAAGSCTEFAGTVSCNLGTITSGNTVNETITVRAISTGNPVTNTASVIAAGDTNAGNNSASANIEIVPLGSMPNDLVVTNVVSNPSPANGESVDFVITVTNDGPGDASTWELDIVTPTGLTFDTDNVVGSNFTVNYSSDTYEFRKFGTMASGESVTMTLTYIVTASAGTNIDNTAAIVSSSNDPNSANDSATDSLTVASANTYNIGPPDGVFAEIACDSELIVDLGGTPITNQSGYDFVFYEVETSGGGFVDMEQRIVYVGTTNAGPWEQVFNWGDGNLDTNTSLGAAGWGGPTGDGAGEPQMQIPMSNPPFYGTAPYETGIAIDIAGLSQSSYQYVRIVGQTCPGPTGELDAIEILTPPSIDLSIDVAVDNATPTESDAIIYTLSTSNLSSTASATGVQVTDLLPADVSFDSATPSHGSYNDGTGIWTIGTLLASETATLEINATVDYGTSGYTITNTATITAADQTDPNNSNDTDSVDINVVSDINVGAPDGRSDRIACEQNTVVDLGGTPIVAQPGYDFAFYEREANPGNIRFEKAVVSVSTSPSGPWTQVFNWGDGVLDANTSLGAAGWGGPDGDGAGEPITNIPATNPPMYGTAPYITGVAVDIDAMGLTGSYQYVQFANGDSCPSIEQLEIDAVEILAPTTEADLDVSTVVDNPTPINGETVNYTITVTNNGPDDAASFTVQTTYPAGLTYSGGSVSGSPGASAINYGTYWEVVTSAPLTSGSSMTATLSFSVTATTGTTIDNTASITASSDDPNNANDSATASLTVINAPGNLNIGLPDGNAQSIACGTSFIVDMGGTPIVNQTGYDVVIFENDFGGPTVGMEPRIVSVSNSPAGPWNQVFNWGDGLLDTNTTLGAAGWGGSDGLGAGESRTEIPVGAPAMYGTAPDDAGLAIDIDSLGLTGPFRYLRIETPTPCFWVPNPDSVYLPPVATTVADITLSNLSISANPINNSGDNSTVQITVTNTGPDNANNVQVFFDVPSGLNIESLDTGCTQSSATVTCTLPSLFSGEDDIFSLIVSGDAAGTHSIGISATANEYDGNGANNNQAASITVYDSSVQSDLESQLTPNIAVSGQNEVRSYELTVTNNGPEDINQYTASHTVTSNLEYISHTVTSGSPVVQLAANEISWTTTSLANGASDTIMVYYRVIGTPGSGVSADLSITNASQTDTNSGNNYVSDSFTVGNFVNIGLPDSNSVDIGCDADYVIDLGAAPINNQAGYDFVMYERNLSFGSVDIEPRVISVSNSPTGPWNQVFNWGDGLLDANTSLGSAAWGGSYGLGAGEPTTNIPTLVPEFYNVDDAGIGIDIDSLGLTGPYRYIRAQTPTAPCDGAHLDSVSIPPPATQVADLTLSGLSVSMDPIADNGSEISTVQITVNNSGPDTATPVDLFFLVPFELTIDGTSANCTIGGSGDGYNLVRCTLASLASSASDTFSVDVTGNTAGANNIRLVVMTHTYDGNITNNNLIVPITVTN